MMKYQTTNHCKYLCQYHIIFCPKFRFSVLNGKIEIEIKKIINNISSKYKHDIVELEIVEDHIHLLIKIKPTVAPMDIVRIYKSILTVELFNKFDYLKKFYGKCGCLWSLGKFISTVGIVDEKTIKKYIQNQKNL